MLVEARFTKFGSGGVFSTGDLIEASFSGADNQAAAANVTGFAFANADVRSFDAEVDVFVDATVDKFERFKLKGLQTGSDWFLYIESGGNDSGVEFTITTAGQVQYTGDLYAGFSSMTISFRALTTSV